MVEPFIEILALILFLRSTGGRYLSLLLSFTIFRLCHISTIALLAMSETWRRGRAHGGSWGVRTRC